MKSLHFISLFAALIASTQSGFAQDNFLKDFAPVAPTPASLGKYGDIPVSYHTGLPNIDIPIYNFTEGSLSVPINLSYHASGIRVQETASWVGLGWALNAGGIITRTVQGAPDERGNNGQTWGWYSEGGNGFNSDCAPVHVASGYVDTEPDIFNFNCGGYSGKFYFDKDRIIKLIPEQDVQIKEYYTSNPSRFDGWMLVTPDGTKYHFGATPGMAYADFVEKSTYTNDPFTSTKPSSWYMSKIESADGKDLVHFTYVDEQYSFWEVSTNTNYTGLLNSSNKCSLLNFTGVKGPIWAKIDGKRLSAITGTNSTVAFIGESVGRQDLNAYSYSSTGDSQAKALKTIEVRGKDNTCLHKFDFSYIYWTSINPGSPPTAYLPANNANDQHDLKRLVLTSLTESDCVSTTNNKIHSFEYYGANLLPRRLSFAQDQYGFYNGNLTNTDLNPGTPFRKTICGDCDYGAGAHLCLNPSKRVPKFPEMQYGTLSKINYPTGGNTTFEYGGHSVLGTDTTCTTATIDSWSSSTGSCFSGQTVTRTHSFTPTQLANGHVELIATCFSGCTSVTASLNVKLAGVTVGSFSSSTTNCNTNYAYRNLSSLGLVANTTYTFELSNTAGTGQVNIYTLTRTPFSTNLLTGGIRIEKITTNDGDTDVSNNIIKTFDYNNGAFQSTGKLVHKPIYVGMMTLCGATPTPGICANFGINQVGICPADQLFEFNNPYSNCPPPGANPSIHLVVSSAGLQPMQTTQGSFIGYTQVKVAETNNGWVVYNYSMGQFGGAPYAPTEFPFTPPPFDPSLGILASELTYNQSANLVKSVEYQYNIATTLTDLGIDPGNWPMKVFVSTAQNIRKYTLNSGYALISQVNERTFNTDLTFNEKVTNFTYTPANGHLQKTAEETINSDNTTYKTQYKYALDYPCPSGTTCDEAASSNAEAKAIYAMRKRNMVALPIEQSTWIKKGSGSFQLTGATYFKFDKVSSSYNNIKLQEVHQLRTNTLITNFAPTTANASTFTKDSRYTREYNFTFSDAFGRLMTQWKENDPARQQYLWGYNNKLPVAKVINSDASGIAFTSFEEPNTAVSTQGNWTIPASGQTTATGDFQTGKSGYNIAGKLISTANTIPGGAGWGNYVISFWLKNGTVNISGSGLQAPASATATGWTYFEKPVKQNSTLTISLSGTGIIDELRLHPVDAQMRTFSYDDNNQNLLSITDENGISAHFDYDSWQRLQAVRDQDRNILQTYEYNYQQAGAALNDVKARTVLTSGNTTIAMVNALSGVDVKKIVQYIDGLGRPIETNAVAQSPTSKDIISFNQYDQYGREPKAFIPYTATSNGGTFTALATAAANQATFATSFGSGGFGYSETVFEPSPLNRPIEQGAPGTVWRTGQGASAHTMRYTWRTNTAGDNVRDFANNIFFAANALWVNQDQGENGNLRWTFTDKMGRVVLVRQELNATEKAETYTIYDDFGRVAYVVPPETTKRMIVGSWDPANSTYAAMIYKYTYDARGRLISKTVPSAGTSTIAYDRLDRPVLTQDANAFKLFTRYDILSRPVISGRYKGTASPVATDPLFESPNTTAPFNYSSTAFPVDNNIDVYKAIYYDDYDLNNDNTVGTGETYTNPAESGYETAAFMRTRGKPTASKTAILKNDNTTPTVYLTTRTYYDKEYSVIQINKQNHLSGADISSNVYDFANRLIKTRRDHTATPPSGTLQTRTIREEYTYDHASRIRFVRHKIDANNWVVTSAPVYDELGRVVDKRLHASNYDGVSAVTTSSAFNYLQSLDYAYNIRGWLTGINGMANCTVQSGDQLADLFSMKLLYDAPTAGSGSAQYNGNISEMQWRTNIAMCDTTQAFRFSYDKGNRLLAANHWASYNSGLTWTNEDKYSESNITYDLNGNIKTFNRRGIVPGGTFGFIDLLSYTYNPAKPDQLTLVGDGSLVTKGFKRNSASTTPFLYDSNGNLTTDLNKSMTVAYNHLNLPKTFTLGANVITMTYTADGEKLTKVAGATTRNYVSGIEYKNAALEAIYNSEGRCTPNGATAFFYEYTIKDHLGNARVSFRANGAAVTFLQENHYYSFGMEMEGFWQTQVGTENSYQYNGKELNEDFGLNLADYGARWADLTLGRWWSVDPMAEKYLSKSSYNYGLNNPIRMIDPNGMESQAYGGGYTNEAEAGMRASEKANEEKKTAAANYKNLEKIIATGIVGKTSQSERGSTEKNKSVETKDGKNASQNAIVVLSAPKHVSGLGHAAVLIGNKDEGYLFYSKNGTFGSSGLNERSSGPPSDNPRIEIPYKSIEEFANSVDNKDADGQIYLSGYAIPISSVDVKAAKNAAKMEVMSYYDVLASSCIDVCSKALFAAGKDPGWTSTGLMLSNIPNNRYVDIIRNNPEGVGVDARLIPKN